MMPRGIFRARQGFRSFDEKARGFGSHCNLDGQSMSKPLLLARPWWSPGARQSSCIHDTGCFDSTGRKDGTGA